jgi:L-threonylcarbamoyladenylate synthase
MVKIISIEQGRDAAITAAAGALRAGELVVFPTDTVYGLGCDAFNRDATAKIFDVKQRPRSLPLPVLVSRPRQAWALCAEVPPQALELAGAFWPGALTIVLPQTPDLSWDLGESRGTIAVRIPANEDLVSLLEIVGPVAMTSANISNEPTPADVAGVADRLGEGVGLYVDGGPAQADAGSTIVDLSRRTPRLIREGLIARSQIELVLGEKVTRPISLPRRG